MSTETITPAEQSRRAELEKIIEKGREVYVEVGDALTEMLKSRLYRSTHGTFKEYFQEQLGLEKSRVKQLMDAAKVAANLKSSTMVELPATERQARPLAKLPAEQQPAAWEKAQEIAKEEGKPVAARHVEAAVAEVMPKTEEPETVVDGTAEEGPRDSERLSLLKSTWTKASKKDKAVFAAWINKNWNP